MGHVVPENQLRSDPLPRPSGNLAMVSVNNPNDDPVKVNIYNEDGSYNLDALDQLNHVLRCRRTDVEKPMDPQLLTMLSHVYDHFGSKPLQIVSGFRNQRKESSNHFKGRATDIRIAGVSPKKIQAFAQTLDRGGMGIGIYPRSQFVHIDVRSPPSFRWIRLLAAEFERGREAPAPRLEAQEARVVAARRCAAGATDPTELTLGVKSRQKSVDGSARCKSARPGGSLSPFLLSS